jgi:hypothetical protein
MLWALVLFFAASLVFAGLRRLTDGEPALVTFGIQLAALAVMIAGLVLFVRRKR